MFILHAVTVVWADISLHYQLLLTPNRLYPPLSMIPPGAAERSSELGATHFRSIPNVAATVLDVP